METVFDFGITRNEMKRVLGYVEPKDEYVKFIDQESAWDDVACLMWHRGNEAAARLYIAKVSPMRQQDFWRTIKHP